MNLSNRILSSSLIAISLLASAADARAERVPEMARYFEDKIASMEGGVCATATDPQAEPEDAWYFRRFWLRVRPKVSFGVPGLVSLEIVPELELLWQRELPDGWKTYKPAAAN